MPAGVGRPASHECVEVGHKICTDRVNIGGLFREHRLERGRREEIAGAATLTKATSITAMLRRSSSTSWPTSGDSLIFKIGECDSVAISACD
jgi:hypothetical protein